MATPRRIEKLQRQILRTVSQTVLYELKDPRKLKPLTFTRVRLSRDLAIAKIYYSVLGDETDRRTAQRFLDHATNEIRRAIADDLTTRVIPELQFIYDPAVEGSIAISATLDEIEKELIERGELPESDDADADADADANADGMDDANEKAGDESTANP